VYRRVPGVVQMAKALDAGAVTAVCRTRNVEQARKLGGDRVIDFTKNDFTSSGEGYDAIVDIAGTKRGRARVHWARATRARSSSSRSDQAGSSATTRVHVTRPRLRMPGRSRRGCESPRRALCNTQGRPGTSSIRLIGAERTRPPIASNSRRAPAGQPPSRRGLRVISGAVWACSRRR
jgi:hypothetical protein